MVDQFDAALSLRGNLDAPPIRQNLLRLFDVSFSHDQMQVIENAAIQRKLPRQPFKRIAVALEFVSAQRAVDKRNVDPY